MSNRKVTPEMVVRIRELHGLGCNQYDISKKVGVSQAAVSRSLNPEVLIRECERYHTNHIGAMGIVGKDTIKCSYPGCTITDWRIIQIGHLNGDGRLDYGRNGKRGGKYGSSNSFYPAIMKGKRLTEDLNLVCANHNWLNEFESSRRVFNPDSLSARVVKMLGGPCVWPDCEITDIRILTKNHKDGGGNKEARAYRGNQNLNSAILRGDVPLDGYNVLCWNHQILYEYQEGRRIDYTNMDIDAEVAARLPDKVGELPSSELTTLSQIAQLRSRIGGRHGQRA